MNLRRSICLLVFLLIAIAMQALTVTDTNLITINGSSFRAEAQLWHRIADFVHEPLSFSTASWVYADSIVIKYSSSKADLELVLKQRSGFGAKAWLATTRLLAHDDLMIRNLHFNMVYNNFDGMNFLKGTEAMFRRNPEFNRNITPYSDKIIEYQNPYQSFWIVASNYADCSGVEYITPQQIHLYDNKLHFFRQFRQSSATTDLPRDCMPVLNGESRQWSFLIFEEQPISLQINRWLGDRRAALSITNDADGETYDRLAAIYYGTNNPDSPLYKNQGIIANNIKISHTTFGTNHSLLKDIHDDIINYGNSIGYHTFENHEDPPGSNAQALLHDLQPYNVRLWIDHSVPNNPECFAYNGLLEGSPHYIGDVINQTNIKYAWMADTPTTDPFNVFNDPWRLPHRLYEVTALEHPVWFFGRTRTQTWEYLNHNITLDLKHRMTPENLDRLLLERGLNICYTHFCFSNWTQVNSFYIITEDGEYQQRPDVEDMWQLLDHYQTHRGLWVETVEKIFDRMLAIEDLQVQSVELDQGNRQYLLTLKNASEQDLEELYLIYDTQEIRIPMISSGAVYSFALDFDSDAAPYVSRHKFIAYHHTENVYIKDALNAGIDPVEVSIYNLKGQRVVNYSGRQTQTLLSIPVNDLASGIYFARLKFPKAGSYSLKFSIVK